MPKTSKPGDAWYTRLTEAEAREVYALDTILTSLKAALKVASKRREMIQNRASMRRVIGVDRSEARAHLVTNGKT